MIERKTNPLHLRRISLTALSHHPLPLPGQEKALTYQFGSESPSSLPSRADWKCLFVAKVGDVQLCDGPDTPVIAAPSASVVFKSSMSTSTQQAPITQGAACDRDVEIYWIFLIQSCGSHGMLAGVEFGDSDLL